MILCTDFAPLAVLSRHGPLSYSQRQCASPLNPAGSHCKLDAYPLRSGFSGPFWRNSLLALILSYTAYKVSAVYGPAAQGADIDHSHDPNETPTEASDKNMPLLTRYLAYHMPREGLWKENGDKRLIAAMKEAEDNHLIRDAQRPIMHRLRYPGMFEQASPHCGCFLECICYTGSADYALPTYALLHRLNTRGPDRPL